VLRSPVPCPATRSSEGAVQCDPVDHDQGVTDAGLALDRPARLWTRGFYTYDQVDNGGEPSADRIIEAYQDLKVGDEIPMWHESRGLSIAYKVDSFEVANWMLWVHRPHAGEAPDSTWSWRLGHLGIGGTRLVTRMKQDYRWNTPGLALFNLVLMEFGDFAMERRMLKGIKVRAERPPH
jgi:hypothetical protein